MKIAERSVDYPRLVLLGTVLMAVFGTYAAMRLPVEGDPRVQIPLVNVYVPHVGASPGTNEAEITREIEDMSGTLDDLDYVESRSMSDRVVVNFRFLESADVKEAKRDVQNLVDQVRPEFPKASKEPFVQDISFAEFPIISVLVTGDEDLRVLRDVAERLESRLEGIPGVSEVDLWGGHEREVQVQLDPNLLNLYGLTYEEVGRAVATANADAPTGSIDFEGGRELRVRFRGKYKDLDAIASTPLAERDGRIILLRDVGEVLDHHKRIRSHSDTPAGPTVTIDVTAKVDVNTLDVIGAVRQIVAAEQGQCGEGIRLSCFDDEGRDIQIMIDQLGTSALYGLILVLGILSIAMGVRNGLIISFALPFSLLTAAGLMLIAKETVDETLAINTMVLFSVILVMGMVVDGALIVGENIYRHVEEGKSTLEAAKVGIREVGPAVIVADLTTISAFAPMLMVSGIMGQFLAVMPVTACFALSGSILVDHFVLPMISRYCMKRPAVERGRAIPSVLNANGTTPVDPSEDHRRTHAAYHRLMTSCLQYRWIVIGGAVGLVAFSAGLVKLGGIGYEFFPQGDKSFVRIDFEMPVGTGVDKTRAVAHALMVPLEDLERRGELYSMPLAVAGRSSRRRSGSEYGAIWMELVDPSQRERTSQEVARYLRTTLPNLPGVRWEVRSASTGPHTGADISLRIKGSAGMPLEELGQIADRIAKYVETIPGTENVTSDYQLRPETMVVPKPQVAALFGVTNRMIARSAQFALTGVEVTEMDFGGQEDIDLRVLNKPRFRNEVKDLKDLPIRTPDGRFVTMDQVAEVKETLGVNQIFHRDKDRVIRVLADVDRDVVLIDDVFAQLKAHLAKARAERDPVLGRTNYSIFYGGENEDRDKSMADLKRSMFVGVALILLILVAQFNSFSQPLIIMCAIPLSFVGVIYGLMFCGFNFSIASMIGVVALTGIVVNDAIVLVDFINMLRRKGMSVETAVIRGGQLRLRPVFLTTFTTVGGLLPLALNLSGGGEFWQPLTVSIISGLIFATGLTLVVVPVAYYTVERLRARLMGTRQKPGMQAAGAAAGS